MSTMVKRVVRKLIGVANENGFKVKLVNDSEENLKVTDSTTLGEMVEHATGADEAQIIFHNEKGENFVVYLAYDNDPEEMIYDHSDKPFAEKICKEVANHFAAL